MSMTATPGHVHGYLAHDNKDAVLKRLRRVEGQVRGLQRMVEDEQYCIDVLTQVSAATKALESVALTQLHDHLTHCVVDAAPAGWPRDRRQGPRGLRRHRPPRPFLTGASQRGSP
jgi:CsoR family transcriptional regulator, copper-sensing transcriptional repressor